MDDSIYYLNKMSDMKMLKYDIAGFNALKNLYSVLRASVNSQDYYKMISKINIEPILSRILLDNSADIRLRLKSYLSQSELEKEKFRRAFYIVGITMSLLTSATEKSANFRIQFHESDGTKAILSYLKDDVFIEKCKQFRIDFLNGVTFLSHTITNFYNLTKLIDKTDGVRYFKRF
jgi:hypothetical protein